MCNKFILSTQTFEWYTIVGYTILTWLIRGLKNHHNKLNKYEKNQQNIACYDRHYDYWVCTDFM